MAELTFTGSYREDDGTWRVFHLCVPASDTIDAERVLERIAETGRIDGELIEEGEADLPFQVGHA